MTPGHPHGCICALCENPGLAALFSRNHRIRGRLPPAPFGCICPPTSEQTCQNPTCPRKPQKLPDFGVGVSL